MQKLVRYASSLIKPPFAQEDRAQSVGSDGYASDQGHSLFVASQGQDTTLTFENTDSYSHSTRSSIETERARNLPQRWDSPSPHDANLDDGFPSSALAEFSFPFSQNTEVLATTSPPTRVDILTPHQTRTVVKLEEPEPESKADATKGAAARFSTVREKMETEEAKWVYEGMRDLQPVMEGDINMGITTTPTLDTNNVLHSPLINQVLLNPLDTEVSLFPLPPPVNRALVKPADATVSIAVPELSPIKSRSKNVEKKHNKLETAKTGASRFLREYKLVLAGDGDVGKSCLTIQVSSLQRCS